MVSHYDDDRLSEIFASEDFLKGYEHYRHGNSEISEFRKFIDNIEINKKYFRLAMNKTGYRKKYHKQNVSEDTRAIKEIQSYLNKMTDQTANKLIGEIKTRVTGRDYLYKMIMESFIEKCIIYPQYISLYLRGLQEIYGPRPDFKESLMQCIDESHATIVNAVISEVSDYLTFCAKNKRLDKLIGHSMLITECEKAKLVKDRIHPSISSLLEILKEQTSDEESYKCVQCLYEILKSLYGTSLLPQGYIDQIKSLIDGETKPKIKYKMMDILERR